MSDIKAYSFDQATSQSRCSKGAHSLFAVSSSLQSHIAGPVISNRQYDPDSVSSSGVQNVVKPLESPFVVLPWEHIKGNQTLQQTAIYWSVPAVHHFRIFKSDH